MNRGVVLCLSAGLLIGSTLLPIAVAAQAVPPTCNGSPATIVGTAGRDQLQGTEGDDVVSLGGGADVFDALGGNDVVCGGDGADSLRGGDGDDILEGGPGRDHLYDRQCAYYDEVCSDGQDELYGGGGDDYLNVESTDGVDAIVGGTGFDTVTYRYASAGVVIDVGPGTATGTKAVDTLDSVEVHEGSGQSDVMLGSAGADALFGSGGNDELRGRAGDDLLSAPSGLAAGGPGDDTYDTGASGYPEGVQVRLGPGADVANLQDEGFAIVNGGRGNDEFRARGTGEGVDADGYSYDVNGGPGADVLSFRRYPGRVVLDVAAGIADLSRDEEIRLSGFSTYIGSRWASDVLRGSPRDERLVGLGGRDTANGRAGKDSCSAEVTRHCER